MQIFLLIITEKIYENSIFKMIIIEYHNYKILHNNPIQIIIMSVKIIIKCILENKYDYY